MIVIPRRNRAREKLPGAKASTTIASVRADDDFGSSRAQVCLPGVTRYYRR